MGLLDPKPTPYDGLAWSKLPFAQRGKMVCDAWAMDGYGTPAAAYVLYALKMAFYVGGWVMFCTLSPSLGGVAEIGSWWLEPLAFQKAVLWSLVFEGAGFGCGSGPLTGRYLPPIGGMLYWLRPGTTKLALFAKAPLIGGDRRSWIDVGVYAALHGSALYALWLPEFDSAHAALVVGLACVLGVLDRSAFLALRPEHYIVVLACFALPGNAFAGAQVVTLALWFWAGFSKLNTHFPSVACVMTSNSPITRFAWMRQRVYRDYPRDLRPSALARMMAHAGTAMELGVPTLFFVSTLLHGEASHTTLVLAMVAMLLLHSYIISNVPMGVPLEWNVMVVYSAFALFWAQPGIAPLEAFNAPAAGALLFAMSIALPLAGNIWPSRISFLLAMRYYAGNWPYSVWLFRGESYRKLERLTTSSPWVYDQLAYFYDEQTSRALVGKVLGFRLMHLHGRILGRLIPRAVDRFEEYEYMDGEIIGGLVLGWNFGDGHLHREELLKKVQAQCEFEEGELRCIFVGAQGLGSKTLPFRIVDAKSGEIERGEVAVAELHPHQAWEAPEASASDG